MRAVGTLTVQDASSRLQHEYAAEIRPRLESRLGFRVVGKLVRRMVNQGDAVKAGQTLAQLDARDLVLGQEVARAAVSNATAQLALSEAEFKRYRDLRDQGFISGLELERRQAALTAARAQAEPARAQAGVQNNQAGYAVLVADVSGVVTGVDAEPGAIKLQAWGEAQNLLPATVREVAAAADPSTRTFLVRADVGATALRLGQTASVWVSAPAGTSQAPSAAVERSHSASHTEIRTLLRGPASVGIPSGSSRLAAATRLQICRQHRAQTTKGSVCAGPCGASVRRRTDALATSPHARFMANASNSLDIPQTHTATLTAQSPGAWALAGAWTVHGLGPLAQQLGDTPCAAGPVLLDGSGITAFDSAGAWLLQSWLRPQAVRPEMQRWQPRWLALMKAVAEQGVAAPSGVPVPGFLARLGGATLTAGRQALAMLAFVGEVAAAAAGVVAHPHRLRWRSVLHHVQVGGFQALPIVGLMSFLLGVVVAYQGADQLRHYGANIFVVDLVGYSMLREFAPLMTAIIIAGRSGSSYAAQIGTMVVTEEIDAMRTIGIAPTEALVLPRIMALAIALPLLTVFADIAGVFGGMVMARTQLDIGFREFLQRFGHEMQGSTFLVGLGKSLVFAMVIAVVGCFQGFRTHGSADSVGRQTTLSVVQSIFIVIVVDAVFSVVFNLLSL